MFLLLFNTVKAENLVLVSDGWDYSPTSSDDAYGAKCTILQEVTLTSINIDDTGNCDSCAILNATDSTLIERGTVVNGYCSLNSILYVGETYRFIENFDGDTCNGGNNDATSYPIADSYINCSAGTYDSTPPPNSFTDNTDYIWSVHNLTYTTGTVEQNLDHLAFSDISNISGINTYYVNFTTNGNYSYTEWYLNNTLVANNSLKYYNFTVMNNTFYDVNISIFWNTTIFNTTYFNFTSNQTTQYVPVSYCNATKIDEIYTNSVNNKEELKMLFLVSLYAIFMFLGYWMIITNNFYLGVLLLVNTLGMDAYFITYIYNNYINGVTLTGWTGNFIYIFAISLIIWVFVKVGSIVMVKSKIKYKI